MKLKIAALGTKGMPHPGGIELVMEEIGTRLVRKGHEFDIFVRKHYMGKNSLSQYRGIGLPRSPGLHNKYLDALSHSASALTSICWKQYNVVYINSVGLSTLAWLPRAVGKKVVVHTHGLDWKRAKWGPLAKRLIRMSAWTSIRLPHLTFCVCLEDKRFLENTYGRPCFYIPNGIPKVIIRKPNQIVKLGLVAGEYLLFMARLVPEKGAHLLLEAWAKIPTESKRGKKLVIAGDSNHRDGYYHHLRTFDRSEDVLFTGFATGRLKEELLSNALCLVQPSIIEGMPLSILEAMGYGRTILASDIKENKDVLSGHCWTFQSGNVDDLSQKIARVLCLRKEILEHQGKKINKFGTENYNWDRIANKVEEILIDLVLNQYNEFRPSKYEETKRYLPKDQTSF